MDLLGDSEKQMKAQFSGVRIPNIPDNSVVNAKVGNIEVRRDEHTSTSKSTLADNVHATRGRDEEDHSAQEHAWDGHALNLRCEADDDYLLPSDSFVHISQNEAPWGDQGTTIPSSNLDDEISAAFFQEKGEFATTDPWEENRWLESTDDNFFPFENTALSSRE